ncbi:hypothetical protein [Streptomyces sp. NPDC002845]
MARRGGCVTDGCLTVLALALVLVVGSLVWMRIEDGQADDEAHDQVTSSVNGTRDRLSDAAGDGALLGTEIERAVRTLGKSRSDVRRDGRRVTVTAPFMGQVGGGFGPSGHAAGCYRFEVVPADAPPPVSVREVPSEACRFSSRRLYRDPADVVEDITVELRAAVAGGGTEAAAGAPVWGTWGVGIQATDTEGGRFTALAWLSGGTGPQGKDCYEFRVRAPRAVTAEKLEPDGCYRIDRERDARQEADKRDRLDASARRIEQRLEQALTDGTLTDTELRQAFALPRTDAMGQPAVDDPVAEPVRTERSSAEVIVVARVRPLEGVRYEGCHEFRADLAEKSVTRRAAGTDCLW